MRIGKLESRGQQHECFLQRFNRADVDEPPGSQRGATDLKSSGNDMGYYNAFFGKT